MRQQPPSSLSQSSVGKLKARYLGPYRVVQLVNEAAVRLELPHRLAFTTYFM